MEALRALQAEEELRDFREVADAIRKARRAGVTPRWMVIVVSKLDLCPDLREKLLAWYDYDTHSPFAKVKAELQAQLGTDGFSIVVRPTAMRLEDFVWAGERVPTAMEEHMRDQLVRELLETIDLLGARHQP